MVSKTTLLSIVTLVAVNNTSAVAMPAWLSSAVNSAKNYVYTTKPVVVEKATQATAPVQTSLNSGINAVKGYATSASNAMSAQATALKNNASALLNSARAVTLHDFKGAVLSRRGAQIGAAAVVVGAAIYYKDEIKDAFKAGYNKIDSLVNRK